MTVCKILVTQPIDKDYDYLIPEGMDVGPGDYVTVPLGPRNVTGVVWHGAHENADVPSKKLKAILHKHDVPPMSDLHRDFVDWVAKYNMAERGAVLKMSIPVVEALEQPTPVTGYTLSAKGRAPDPELSLKPQHQKIIELLSDGLPRRASEIAHQTNVTTSVLKTMLKLGLVKEVDLFTASPCSKPDGKFGHMPLSKAQSDNAAKITDRLARGGYECFLLDGVTGAGKTEAYFEAVATALEQDRQILILLPEIALSNAFITRFYDRFGCTPALWHSSLTPAQRRMTWRGIATGKTRVVVGARSALMLPYANLGLVIVDEEHDPVFKQEEITIYNARDMAIVRANLGQIPIVLVSATPSLETISNIWNGKYTHLELPQRFGNAVMPDISIVDLREHKPERQHFISPILKEAIEKNLEKGEQSLLFLNRRGYAPLTLCRTCGHRFQCPQCTAWLVEHRKTGKLQCHHCGYSLPIPDECPVCHDTGSLAPCGPGVERIAEEVKEYWPDARVMILASDVTDTHDKIKDALKAVRDHEVDIIIGTQIIAKGHHFPKLTVVGIVDGDLGLSGGDLRATERSFQLLHQVAGRAGREKLKGEVYLQTWNPEQRVMTTLASDDRNGFLEIEAEERELARMPPFTRLAALIFASLKEDVVKETALQVVRAAPRVEGVDILGPAPAQMYKIRNKYRYRVLIRAEKNLNLQKYLSEWLDEVKIPTAVRLTIDIDPQSFL